MLSSNLMRSFRRTNSNNHKLLFYERYCYSFHNHQNELYFKNSHNNTTGISLKTTIIRQTSGSNNNYDYYPYPILTSSISWSSGNTFGRTINVGIVNHGMQKKNFTTSQQQDRLMLQKNKLFGFCFALIAVSSGTFYFLTVSKSTSSNENKTVSKSTSSNENKNKAKFNTIGNTKVHLRSLPSTYRRPRYPPTFGKSILSSSSFSSIFGRNKFHSHLNLTTTTTSSSSSKEKYLKTKATTETIETTKNFGKNIDHNIDNINTNNENEDCPICKKYSKGPCGEIFLLWLDCTDKNSGIDPITKQDLHLTECVHYVHQLKNCLEKNHAFYENDFNDNKNEFNVDDNSTDNSKQEKYDTIDNEKGKKEKQEQELLESKWEYFINDLLSNLHIKKEENFNIVQMIMRPNRNKKSVTGVGSFQLITTQTLQYNEKESDSSNNNKNNEYQQQLLMAFVQDTNTNKLLSAGSLEDLLLISMYENTQVMQDDDDNTNTTSANYNNNSTVSPDDVNENEDYYSHGILQFKIPKQTKSITSWALYEYNNNDDANNDILDDNESCPNNNKDSDSGNDSSTSIKEDNLVLYYQVMKVPPVK